MALWLPSTTPPEGRALVDPRTRIREIHDQCGELPGLPGAGPVTHAWRRVPAITRGDPAGTEGLSEWHPRPSHAANNQTTEADMPRTSQGCRPETVARDQMRQERMRSAVSYPSARPVSMSRARSIRAP